MDYAPVIPLVPLLRTILLGAFLLHTRSDPPPRYFNSHNMTSTLPYRPSEDTFDTFPASGTNSNRSKTNGLPRLTPSPSVLKRSPSSQTSLRRPSNHVAIPHSASNSSKPRRCKSQYPLDSPERHVEYILVASFHIDRGPIMEHQYPAPISGDESMLAELMLPDQTHVRSQDWTIFFLHKDTSAEDEEESAQEKKKKRKNERNARWKKVREQRG